MEAVIVVEVLGGHDRVRARHRIAAPGGEAQATVGRSATCDVVLDDPFVAAVHARIDVDGDGNVVVSDLDSVNGVEIGGLRLHGAERVPVPDGVIRIGRTRLRVRTGREILAPEQADRGGPSRQARAIELKMLGAGFVVSLAAIAFEVWTATTQPRELSTALVTMLLTVLVLAGLWIALWALASRVAFGESRWIRHAVTVFVAYAALAVVGLVAEVLNGALGWHLGWSVVGPVLVGVAAAAALSCHLVNASPMRTPIAVTISVAIPAVILAAMLWMQARSENRSPSHIADRDRILPPVFVLRRGRSLDDFAVDLADLKARADALRAFVEKEDPSPGDDEPD